MSEWRLIHAISMADEIVANCRRDLMADAEALLSDLRCEVRARYAFNRVRRMTERAEMLGAWATLAESLKPKEDDAQASDTSKGGAA